MQLSGKITRMAIVALWIILVAILVRGGLHQTGPPADTGPRLSTAPLASEESWMGVYMQDRKIGYTHHRVTPLDDGYRLEEQSLLRLTVMETTQTVNALVEATTTPDYALRTFAVSLNSGVGFLTVHGEVREADVTIRMVSGGEESEQRFPVSEPIYIPSSARAHLTAAGFQAGQTMSLQVFDPSAMENHPMQVTVERRQPVRVNGQTVDAWRVRESFRGMESTVWFDDGGNVIREEGPMGLVSVRESPGYAMSGGWAEDAAFDLMAVIAVPVREAIPAPRRLRRLAVRVGGLGDMPVPADARQSYRDGLLVVQKEDAAAEESYTLPYEGGQWETDLVATIFLQSEHPRIRATARRVLAGEMDARRAAERLRQWVFQRLEKTPVASLPNALQVLEMGAGDCNEHAVLWAALARAAGLPARVVAGVVYTDEVFLYHAWNEVWLGSGWVSVDPAFDQMPADATHIKLIEGGPEAHAALVAIIGKLSLEVIEAEGPALGRWAPARSEADSSGIARVGEDPAATVLRLAPRPALQAESGSPLARHLF